MRRLDDRQSRRDDLSVACDDETIVNPVRDDLSVACDDETIVNPVRDDLSVADDKRWVKGRFSWQEGFGGFSYSRCQIAAVATYIENQEAHHGKRSFKHEYLALLKKFDIAFDDRYVFKWVEDDE